MRISDWSSDVCSSDLAHIRSRLRLSQVHGAGPFASHQPWKPFRLLLCRAVRHQGFNRGGREHVDQREAHIGAAQILHHHTEQCKRKALSAKVFRSEEHTSELQSLMRISYAVFCLKKKKQ